MTSIQRTPKLADCTIESLLGCVLTCTQLGLEPDSVSGRAYLIPYGNQCTLIIGYKGLMELARRSGKIKTLEARVVHEKDVFDYEYGTDGKLRHRPAMVADRGEIVAAYAIARMTDEGEQLEVMSKQEIEDIRSRSKAATTGPWMTDYAEMARKTVMRRLCKYLPSSAELSQAVTIDEQADAGIPQYVEPISFEAPQESRTKQLAKELADRSMAMQEPEAAPKRKPGRPKKEDQIRLYHTQIVQAYGRLKQEERAAFLRNVSLDGIGEVELIDDLEQLKSIKEALPA